MISQLVTLIKDECSEMEKTGSEGTIWTCSLYVPLRSFTVRLLTWIHLKYLAIKCSYHHLHPSSYPNSTRSTVARSDIRSSDSSATPVAVARAWIIHDSQQLSIMDNTVLAYGETDVFTSWPEPEPYHHPATRGPRHNLGPDECDHKQSTSFPVH